MDKVYKSIARLVYYSNGGFSYTELYHGMPVYVRNFMAREIQEIKDAEQKQAKKKRSSSGSGNIADMQKFAKNMKKGGNKKPDKSSAKSSSKDGGSLKDAIDKFKATQ